MGDTKIDWATKCWNVVTGCSKVSLGCKNCWAKSLHDKRHKAYLESKKMPKQYAIPFEQVQLHPDRLDEPLHWSRPQRIFVASGGDLFHDSVGLKMIEAVFGIAAACPQHTFLILTKRAENMKRVVNEIGERNRGMEIARCWAYSMALGNIPDFDVWRGYYKKWPLPNVWLGVSAENQAAADERVPLLLQTPAAVRFVSVEPMLGEIDFTHIKIKESDHPELGKPPVTFDALRGWMGGYEHERTRLDWVISGCESGPQARPMELDWARSLRDQCQEAGTPFFFKQAMIDGKLVHMPELDGRVWNEFPEAKP